MPLVKSVSVDITVEGTEDAKLKIDQVAVKAEELKRLNPEITPKIDAAKALLEARLLREGLKAELSKAIEVRTSSGGNGNFLQRGIFSAFNNDWAQNGGGSVLTNPAALAGIAVGIGALLPELAGVVSGFAAATAGAGAFYLLAHPAINNLTQDYQGLNAAENTLQLAQNKYKIDPTATTLKALQTAQVNLKAVQMSMSQDAGTAVGQMQKLGDAWHKITNAFQPTAFKVFGDGLKTIRDLLPAVVPMATAFAGAIDGLLKKVDEFARSPGFKQWLGQFDNLIGPAVSAIGTGIGKIVVAFGKLLTVMSSKDVVHAINIVFDAIAGTITGLSWVIVHLMHNWDDFSQRVAEAWRFIEIKFDEGAMVVVGVAKMLADGVLAAFGAIIDGAAKAFGWVPGIGGHLKSAAAQFDNFRISVDNSLGGAEKTLGKWVTDLQNAPKIAKLRGDVTDLNAKLDWAEKRLADPNLTKARTARIQADISNVDSQLAKVRAMLAALNGTTATTYVNTIAGPGTTPGTKKRAAGGWASGLTLVGERGPELLQVPAGSYVYNNSQTRGMLSGSSGGATYNINVRVAPGGEREAGRQIVNAIRAFEKGSGSGWRHP